MPAVTNVLLNFDLSAYQRRLVPFAIQATRPCRISSFGRSNYNFSFGRPPRSNSVCVKQVLGAQRTDDWAIRPSTEQMIQTTGIGYRHALFLSGKM